ncbi:MAG: STT3 domain-containing protein [Candidatus Hodarchaeales archaeon]
MSTIVTRVSDDLRDRYEFARTHLKRETVLSQLALVAILLIAFILRFMQILEVDPTLRANDPYSQIVAARYINDHGLLNFFSWYDTESWYPYGRNWGNLHYVGTPLTAVILHRLSILIGMPISLDLAAYYAPGVLGTLSVLMIYLLGKELANKKVGLFAAFFLSFSPGHIQRSVVGFFDNEALGIFLMLVVFYFFLRALRMGSIFQSVLSGISLGILMGSWGASTYVIQLLALYTVVLILLKRYSERLLIAYGGTIVTALMIAVNVPRVGPSLILDFDGLLPIGVLGLLLILDFYQHNQEQITQFPFLTKRNLEFLGYGVVLAGIGFVILNFFIPIVPIFRGKFITVIIPFFREDTPILKSVAEHLIVTWGSLFRNLFILVFLIPIGILYAYRKPTERNIFLLIFGLTTLYFSGSMVRLILILAPAAALLGAKAIDETLIPYAQVFQEKFFLSKRKRAVSTAIGNEHVGLTFIVIFLVLMFSLFQGATLSRDISIQPASVSLEFRTQSGPNVKYGDWYETFDWFSRETPPTSVIASWWDYGYWLTTSNRTILVDNATINSTQIGNIGAVLVGPPDLSLKIAKYYDINYIVVLVSAGQAGADQDLGKVQWMVKISEANSNLAPALGHPIDSDNYFAYDERSGNLIGYDKDFFKSVIWAIMTEGVDDQIKNGFTSQAIVQNRVTSTGFHSDYTVYKEIFKEAFFSSNKWVRVFEIDWDAAERLVGI